MGRKLKLRITRVLPSFLACHSKGAPWMPESPLHSLPSVNPKNLDVSLPAAFTKPSSGGQFINDTIPCIEEGWGTEDRWHVVSLVDDQSVCRKISISPESDERAPCPPASPASPVTSVFTRRVTRSYSRKGCRRRASYRRKRPNDSSTDSGWFSSEEEDEADTLFSSRSLSSASSDFIRNRRPCIEFLHENANGCRRIPPGGKVGECFPVVKESSDPYVDFMVSMMEMIVAKEIFDAGGLEQLLDRFLFLNDPCHHGVILRVFSDVWGALFSDDAGADTGSR